MSCKPSSSTHCSSDSQRYKSINSFPRKKKKDTNQESTEQRELIPISQKYKFGNPQMKGFTISTISDVYNRTGAEIITCFSIFDANLEDFHEGCVLTFPNIVREKICEKNLTTTLNVRSHGVLMGTYHCGGIPRENEHRSQTIYRIYDEIKKIVKENTNWEKWGLKEEEEYEEHYWDDEYIDEEDRSYTIYDYNNIPVLFYTDDFIDLEQGNEISFSNVPIKFIIGKYFIAIPLYINETFRGYAVAQKTLWDMAGDQAGVAIFTTGTSWNTSAERKERREMNRIIAENKCDAFRHPPYLVGNYKMKNCTNCGRDCLDDGYEYAVFSKKYFRPR